MSAPERQPLMDEVLEGLSEPQKRLPPKLLYDPVGSALFERICDLPEYYLTRAEEEILSAHAGEIAREMGPEPVLIELGSGASRKTKLLLDQLPRGSIYVPVDISSELLLRSAGTIARRYPELRVAPLTADFTSDEELGRLQDVQQSGRTLFFSGSTIGNMEPSEALRFLKRTSNLVGPGGRLLIGIDLVKNPEILIRAYNDAEGITAAFNLNVLKRLNSELSVRFDPDQFKHEAYWNPELSRMEMRLVSRQDQMVRIGHFLVPFKQGEFILTENSYKYEVPAFERLVRDAGFEIRRVYRDQKGFYALFWLQMPKGAGHLLAKTA